MRAVLFIILIIVDCMVMASLAVWVGIEGEIITVQPADKDAQESEATFVNMALSSSAGELSMEQRHALIAYVFGDTCRYPICRITESEGGAMEPFLLAGAVINTEEKGLLIIDGPCASACALAADLARDKTCITELATFEFHKWRTSDSFEIFGWQISIVTEYGDPPQSESIDAWVQTHGGYPYAGTLEMPNAEARTFWRQCKALLASAP